MLRSYFGLAAAVFCFGCGASGVPEPTPCCQEEVKPAAPEGTLTAAEKETAPPAPLGDASQSSTWWTETPPCPAESTLSGAPPPEGTAVLCQTDKRVNQGRGTTFHANGKKKAEGAYDGNFATGIWTEWDDAGNISRQAEFRRGSEHGKVIEWHPNGKVKALRVYVNGVRNGPSILWDEDGNERLYMPYKDGLQDGVATHWTTDGRVLKLERWVKDELVQTQK